MLGEGGRTRDRGAAVRYRRALRSRLFGAGRLRPFSVYFYEE
ncbi:hypothetical protein STXM2123_3407 [Streptomyces sp. F-3]|nr:hypothetical protein STXM2123_3407 [Streptomyces sp. F-3]